MGTPADEYHRQILEQVASGQRITQRGLASRLGVALGLTNLLIRRLVAKGYLRVTGLGTRHVRYMLTTAGWNALQRATRTSLENTVRLYTGTREKITNSLFDVSRLFVPDADGQKRIVFYGAGDVAEIAYVSLLRTDLTLVGVVDDSRTGRFFDLPIRRLEELSANSIAGEPYAHIVVTSLRHADALRKRLMTRSIPASRVTSL